MKLIATVLTLIPFIALNQTINFLGSTPNNGGCVYHLNNSYFLSGYWSAVDILDYTNPGNISNTGSYSAPGDCWFLKAFGNIAYFGGGTTQSLTIADITNPSTPVVQTTIMGLPWIPTGAAIKDNYLYLTFGNDSFYVLDQTNLSNPIFLDTINISGIDSREMVIIDTVLCIATQNGLKTFDISTPQSPTFLGSIGGGYIAICADTLNKRVFVSKGGFGSTAGFDAIDISNPTSPSVTFSGGSGFTAMGIGYYNNTVIQGGPNLVAAYTVSLSNATMTDSYILNSQVVSVDVRDSIFFTCDMQNASVFNFGATTNSLNTVSIDETKMFPIPAGEQLNIKTGLTIEKVLIYSLDGTIILKSTGDQKIIDISSLSKGTYIIEISTENSIITEQIVKI